MLIVLTFAVVSAYLLYRINKTDEAMKKLNPQFKKLMENKK